MKDKLFPATILPTACFPNAAYLFYIENSEKIFIELHETYPKQTWRNRYSIMTSNGVLDLSIPVKKPEGNNTKTKDIIIDHTQKWQHNHWRAIESGYKKSPFYFYYEELIAQFFRSKHAETLVEWNSSILSSITEEFGLNKNFSFTDSFRHSHNDANDMRYKISPKAKENEEYLIFSGYTQVFMEKHPFVQNLSVIDLIFNIGPDIKMYIRKMAKDF